MSKENLPIQLKNKQLAVNKRNNKRTIERIKRVGKIILSAGVGLTGVAVSAIAGPLVATVGMGVGVAGLSNAAIDAMYKKNTQNSMFVQRRNAKGEIYISQSVKDIKSFQKMKGFNAYEKGAMMGLELITELQSIKQRFEDKGVMTEPSRDGQNNVYPQIYSTTTHGVNIDTMQALETLGYLQIERKEPKNKSNLFFEKLGFGQYQEAKEALFSKDESKKVQMYDLALRVTDKPIDFEQIYKSYLDLKGTREKSETISSIKRLGIIMEALRKRNIDIVKNDIGETVIDYKAEESFATRVKREQANSNAEYRKSFYIGDTIEQGTVKQQEVEPTKSKTEPALNAEER
ncbi:MAG: hypothetical protein IJE68_04960 [Clostridia bacterium]|nr:hypothetical protein [Clostridia bacterium]